jgi:hypothetical protein
MEGRNDNSRDVPNPLLEVMIEPFVMSYGISKVKV